MDLGQLVLMGLVSSAPKAEDIEALQSGLTPEVLELAAEWVMEASPQELEIAVRTAPPVSPEPAAQVLRGLAMIIEGMRALSNGSTELAAESARRKAGSNATK
jgi:hypothetical protein